MPQSTISRIESGTTTGVDFDTLDKVAAALGVHPSDLIAFDQIPFDFGGKTYLIADSTAEADSIPPGASAMWTVQGTGISFPGEAGESPGDLIKKAKRLMGGGRARGT